MGYLNDQVAVGGYEFDFFMSGREFVVGANFDYHAAFDAEGNGGIDHLWVTLVRGQALDNPCWGPVVP
jgi:hypothetical protein